LIPGIVIDVSATFVAITISHVPSYTGLNTNYCYSGDSIEYKGRIRYLDFNYCSSYDFNDIISALPVKKTKIPPSGS